MAHDISGLESYFPVPAVQHADQTVDGTVRVISALNTKTRLVLASPNRAVLVTFDGTDPAADGRGHLYGPGSTIIVNEYTASQINYILAYADDTDGIMTVTEMQRG